MAATDEPARSASNEAPAAGRGERLTSLDRMRGFVIGLVVLHHAVLAYCTFGHIDRANFALSTAPVVDPQRWIGFDVLVRLDDAFFMPLLFLLSGLFVRDGLIRHGTAAFLRARMRRLGPAFVVAVLTVVPLAYYPAFLQAGGRPGFGRFWVSTVTTGPWPSGPPWFIGVLLAFDAAAALVVAVLSRRRATGSAPPPAPGPVGGFAWLLVGSCLLFLPLLLAVGPTRWFGIGPLAVQGSRIGLYAAYFVAGVGLGRGGLPAVAAFGRAVARRWAAWVLLAALTGATFLAVGTGVAWTSQHRPSLALVGLAQAAFCAAAGFALPALFLRFGEGRAPAWDSLAANGFAIYLLHYPFVTWAQYGLLATRAGAPVKGAITVAVALLGSWASASVLRRLPGVRRIL
ncbi:acyltransferase [uncultured Methylobacterium sp.]|jgi:glucan biosynthesis protein C|uniref:acyltransferase family protein n=1 Tax=uncultured Methylobacterium sp. TaxID=157278 RepID=UPI0026293A4E|nr:acyltransferase [uncultured Methylobacterium sp.]